MNFKNHIEISKKKSKKFLTTTKAVPSTAADTRSQKGASLRRRGHFLPSNRSLRKPKGAVGIAFNRPTNEPDNFKEFYWIVRRQDSKP